MWHQGSKILSQLLIFVKVWRINRERAVDYLNTRSRIYVVDGFAGWDERYRINVRVVCARAYHALFMRNMLIRPRPEELEHFEPDYVIYNAGSCKLYNIAFFTGLANKDRSPCQQIH